MTYTPHTDADIATMLAAIGKPSLDALFAHLPADRRLDRPLDLPRGRSEDEVQAHIGGFAHRNDTDAVCFAGGGAYDHYVPAIVSALVSRGELLTAYTPYQPEVSQGVLQALFEYQTAISELTGLPISNASLYDGGSAVAEAVSMACAASGREAVVMSAALDLPSRRIVRTYAEPLGRSVREVAYDLPEGTTPVSVLGADVGTVVIQQPNALGVVEDVAAHAEAAHEAGAQLVVKFDPSTAGVLARPGTKGADIVVGEGQPLGQGLVYGGPTVGFLACTDAQVRRLPGRVVGKTIDVHGNTGYVMTLRAREQDIRRERATSNICTNQTLNAIAALVYLSWLGPGGLVELGRHCLARARHAVSVLGEVPGVTPVTTGPFVKEFPVALDVPDPQETVRELHRAGYLIGPVQEDGPAAGAVLVAVTERRTRAEVEGLAEALGRAVKETAWS